MTFWNICFYADGENYVLQQRQNKFYNRDTTNESLMDKMLNVSISFKPNIKHNDGFGQPSSEQDDGGIKRPYVWENCSICRNASIDHVIYFAINVWSILIWKIGLKQNGNWLTHCSPEIVFLSAKFQRDWTAGMGVKDLTDFSLWAEYAFRANSYVLQQSQGHHWFIWLYVTYSVPNHYLNQWWFINGTDSKKLQWNLNQNTNIFF